MMVFNDLAAGSAHIPPETYAFATGLGTPGGASQERPVYYYRKIR